MNEPSTLGDNWKWRLKREQVSDMTLYNMKELTRIYGRLRKETPVKEKESKDTEKEELISSAQNDKIDR